jgi:gliding motility-associated lipoprotein GldH
MIKKLFYYLFLPASLCSLLACGKEHTLFEKKYDLKSEQWTYSDSLNFAFNITDTMAIYDIVLSVKHTPQYAFQNMYTNIYTQFPTGERVKQLLNIDLADNTGKWEGKCSGSECVFEIPIQPNAFFNQTGQHVITLEQYMRSEALSGIKNIALRIVDKGIKRDLEAEKASKTKKKNNK